MKWIFALVIVSLTALAASGQNQHLPVDPNTGKVSYYEVVTAPGQSLNKLFGKAKKWIATKHSEAHPYTISYESEKDGNITAKGSFTLPAERRRYIVQFLVNISTKDGKYRYEFTDLVVQFTTAAGASGGGFGYWSSSSYKEAETLQYSIETFYPIRLERKRKPDIQWYEEVNAKSFETIDHEIRSLAGSLKETLTKDSDW